MNEPAPKTNPRNAPPIASAEWLFQDGPAHAASSQPAPIVPDSGEGFALADVPGETDASSTGARAGGAKPPPQGAPRPGMVGYSAPAVEQVWSRGAEWGPTLLSLGGWAACVLFLLYVTMGAEMYGSALFFLFLGGVVGVFLSYPILVTLERPVRVTPEQAARDYFGALSHHFPHYRRMWLLLGTKGRTSAYFASYEGFKTYWKNRLDQLREGHAGPFAPLVFQVEDFRGEKSAGQSEIQGEFRLRVFVRGRRGAGPILNTRLERDFVRGPDKMWYLEDGTLE
ncbi:MAG: hypothetical protein ACP5XB_26820 [Isosphaeraceae bacterium]